MSDYIFSPAALLRHLNNKVHDETYACQNITECPIYIMECPIYNFLPWNLPGLRHVRDKRTEQCFFVSRERSEKNPSNPKRTIKDKNGEKGVWKTNGECIDVFREKETRDMIGCRHGLVFMYNGERSMEKTPWIMHEYTLPLTADQNGKEIFQKWVVCTIKRSGQAKWSRDIEEVNHNGSIVSSNLEGRDANNTAQYMNAEQLPQQHHYSDVQENIGYDVIPMEYFYNEEEILKLDQAMEFIGQCKFV